MLPRLDYYFNYTETESRSDLFSGDDAMGERWASRRAESRWGEAVNQDPLALALEIFAQDTSTETIGSFAEPPASASPPPLASKLHKAGTGCHLASALPFSSGGLLAVTWPPLGGRPIDSTRSAAQRNPNARAEASAVSSGDGSSRDARGDSRARGGESKAEGFDLRAEERLAARLRRQV